jgi:hypothetical protein
MHKRPCKTMTCDPHHLSDYILNLVMCGLGDSMHHCQVHFNSRTQPPCPNFLMDNIHNKHTCRLHPFSSVVNPAAYFCSRVSPLALTVQPLDMHPQSLPTKTPMPPPILLPAKSVVHCHRSATPNCPHTHCLITMITEHTMLALTPSSSSEIAPLLFSMLLLTP